MFGRLSLPLALLFLLAGSTSARAGRTESEAARQRGLELAKSGDVPAGLAELEKATKLDPSYAEAFGDLGNTRLMASDLPGAISALDRAVQLRSDYTVARYNLAYALRKTGNHKRAADQYRLYLQASPDDPDAHYGLAESLRALGEKLAAAEAYDAYAIAERRPAQQKWVEKAKATAAELRAQAGPPPPSPPPAPKSASAAAPPPVAPAPVAREERPRPKSTPAAAATPKHLSFSKSPPPENAAATTASAVSASPEPKAGPPPVAPSRPDTFRRGLVELEKAQFQAAKDQLLAASAERPDDPLTCAALGSAHLGLYEGPAAEAQYQRALKGAPDDARAAMYLGLGEAQRIQGKNDAAKISYQKVLDDEKAPQPVRAQAQDRLAALSAGKG